MLTDGTILDITIISCEVVVIIQLFLRYPTEVRLDIMIDVASALDYLQFIISDIFLCARN